jgi:hypothetical protein
MTTQSTLAMSSNTQTTEKIAPWYKHFWLWFIIFFPALAVVAGIITIKIAVDNADSLVRDDYYKAGKAINKDLALDRATAAKNIQANLTIDTTIGEVQIQLQGKIENPPETLTLDFIHPTIQSQDFNIEAKHSRQNIYISQLAQSLNNHWYLQISDRSLAGSAPNWRLKSSINLDNSHDGLFKQQLTASQ